MGNAYTQYRELILRLAQTDFKLRYHGSVLGYVWAIMKPLLLFSVLNFVFSFIFNFRDAGVPFYSLQLLTALLLFNFFSEGTVAGMTALVSKSQLVTKTAVPRWALVVASTLNALFVFGMNVLVLVLFFVWYGKLPTLGGIGVFVLLVACLYALVVAFSFLTATVFVHFRDLAMIWEVLLSVIMYASPIIYPLSIIPQHLQWLILMNPMGFIVHYAKNALIIGVMPPPLYLLAFIICIVCVMSIGIMVFRAHSKDIAEYI